MDSAVRSTLYHVTDRKLKKIAAQIERYNEIKAYIQYQVASKSTKTEQIQALLHGCKTYGITTGRNGMSIKNTLQRDIEIQGVKYEYASLFGKLVTEWMQNPNDAIKQLNASTEQQVDTDDSNYDSTSTSDSFEPVGRKEMHEQRQEWESYAFVGLERDQIAIDEYLNDLFSSAKQAKKVKETPLHQLQTTMSNFDVMEPKRFTEDIVRWCIDGVIQSDLFAGQKRKALVDLKSCPAVLKEMADVLNMDLDGIEDWKWDPAPVRLSMRPQLNGKYRVYNHEEIHQALFLHFIGARWSVYMKKAFTAFYHSGAWSQTPFRAMDRKSRRRREHFLGPAARVARNRQITVRDTRRRMYHTEFFMTQLPNALKTASRDHGDDGHQEDLISYSQKHVADTSKSPLEIKESMHRLATTDLLLNKKLYGEFTIVQSDFKWFGPAMPHDTIFAVLKFLGIKSQWLTFFRAFLETPTVWSQDGPSGSVTTRKRGIPMSHVLSDALGEAVLFCLDFAVNQKSGGSDLYRFHDDLLFWGQESVCIRAWKALLDFSQVMGLELNEKKTGSVQVFEDQPVARPLAEGLPAGDITWGFLRLDPSECRWLVDESKIKEHVAELHRQLKTCRSVFAWIQAWNSYVCRFLATNMGRPAACFGVEHVEMVTRAFADIQRTLFQELLAGEEDCSSVNEFLRRQIKARFGVDNVPDGFLFFPTRLGGLGVRNPLIPLNAVRDIQVKKTLPEDEIRRAFEEDEEEYEAAKKRFEQGDTRLASYPPDQVSDSAEQFLSLAEFTSFREETSTNLGSAFNALLQPTVMHNLEGWGDSAPFADFTYSGQEMGKLRDPYWTWIFGGIEIGKKGMLPLGLVDELESERPRWSG
ncbi:hypothetical protein EJ08DRAFT_673759 [Tothia fuscella]|uniref:Reverse transcriptase domain-containing protein n=1 Tax=Tothia fuscella TaxID=1048955 RepID=A0A9P4NDX7_9PEZI|nr:hypothetical protein EJ08DRAFT_673759 [Tothia fuscella]